MCNLLGVSLCELLIPLFFALTNNVDTAVRRIRLIQRTTMCGTTVTVKNIHPDTELSSRRIVKRGGNTVVWPSR